jgi:hypothetical protein
MKIRKEDQKQDFFLGLFSSGASRKKNCLYKHKKMYKKIEKYSKICLCMIKKTSYPLHRKKISPKQNHPTNN